MLQQASALGKDEGLNAPLLPIDANVIIVYSTVSLAA